MDLVGLIEAGFDPLSSLFLSAAHEAANCGALPEGPTLCFLSRPWAVNDPGRAILCRPVRERYGSRRAH